MVKLHERSVLFLSLNTCKAEVGYKKPKGSEEESFIFKENIDFYLTEGTLLYLAAHNYLFFPSA